MQTSLMDDTNAATPSTAPSETPATTTVPITPAPAPAPLHQFETISGPHTSVPLPSSGGGSGWSAPPPQHPQWALSYTSRMFCGALPVGLFLLSLWHWQFTLVSTLLVVVPLFLPKVAVPMAWRAKYGLPATTPYGLARWWHDHSRDVPLDDVVNAFAQGMIWPVFIMTGGTFQGLTASPRRPLTRPHRAQVPPLRSSGSLSSSSTSSCARPTPITAWYVDRSTAQRCHFTTSPHPLPQYTTDMYWFGFFLLYSLSWTAFVVIEEHGKLHLARQHAKSVRAQMAAAVSANNNGESIVPATTSAPLDEVAHTMSAVFTGVGYAIAQSITVVLIVCSVHDNKSSRGGKDIVPAEFGELVLTALLFALCNVPLHATTSYCYGQAVADETDPVKATAEAFKFAMLLRVGFFVQGTCRDASRAPSPPLTAPTQTPPPPGFTWMLIWLVPLAGSDPDAGFAMMIICQILTIGGIFYYVARKLGAMGVDLHEAGVLADAFSYAAMAD